MEFMVAHTLRSAHPPLIIPEFPPPWPEDGG
jgi:hypothetical protein